MPNTTRRELITGGICAALLPKIGGASPVKSMLGATEQSLYKGLDIPSASEYVQDGIVRLFDGIENAGYETHWDGAWLDLITGQYAALCPESFWQENCLSRRTKNETISYMAAVTTDSYSRGLARKFKTIEIVADITAQGFVFCDQSYNIQAQKQWNPHGYIWATNDRLYLGNYSAFSCTKMSGPATYAFTQEVDDNGDYATTGAFVNGIREDGPAWNNYYSGNIIISIGGGNRTGTTRNILGDIYAVRTYDRPLTDEEIAYNHQLDCERFGI